MATLSQVKAPPQNGKPAPTTAPPRQPKTRAEPPAYLQAKLNLSRPGDRYEQEADQVADRVMREPLQRTNQAPHTAPEQVQTKTLRPGISSLPEAEQAQQAARSSLSPGDDAIQLMDEPLRRQVPTACRQCDPIARSDDPALQTQVDNARRTTDVLQRQPESLERQQDATVPTQTEQQASRASASVSSGPEKVSRIDDPTVQTQAEQACRAAAPTDHRADSAEGTAAAANGKVPAEIETRIRAARGAGDPLPDALRSRMQQRFDTDFSAVRVHTDAEADALATALNARAFTVGNDIFFAAGRFDPDSAEGQRLLAHELTHVVQQNGSIHTSVQRDDNAPEEELVDGTQLSMEVGRVNTNDETPENGEIRFSTIAVPSFKNSAHRGGLYASKLPLHYYKNYTRGNPNQRDYWKSHINKTEISESLRQKLRTANHSETVDDTATHIFTAHINNLRYIGNLEQIAIQLTTPVWGGTSRRPPFKRFDVDHIVELQLSGWNGSGWPNTLNNMELLESALNQESGRTIKQRMDAKVQNFIDATHDRYGRSVATVKQRYHLYFEAVTGSGGEPAAAQDFWTRVQIEAADHMNPIQVGNLADIGGDGRVMVFPNEFGGIGKQFLWPGELNSAERNWFKAPFEVKSKAFNTEDSESENIGSFTINVKPDDSNWQQFADGDETIPVKRFPGAQYAGYVVKNSILGSLRKLRHQKTSPVEMDSLELLPDQGIVANGRIVTDIPIIRDAAIQFSIANGEIQLFRTFTIGEVNVPSPFSISESSFTLFASTTDGLGGQGKIYFGIEHLGDGDLEAAISTGGGFELAGHFDFDSRMFDPACVGMSYRDRQLGLDGQLGIPEGKVTGIKSATINAQYQQGDGEFSASGDAELDVPGVEHGTLELSYSEQQGFSIGGTFDLSSDVPGIRSGSISATLEQREGGDGYKVSATGEAQPDIPGIDSALSVEYDDGAIAITGSARYQRGMLDGSVNVGVTNRALDSEGRPSGEPEEQLKVYGGGSLSLQIAPWLQATAGVKFAPDGEITVCGEVGLPSQLEIFARREIDKRILSISFPIPIVPGLSAEIGGSLSANAGIGPGVIDQLRLGVEYTPSAEENTRVTGDAHLNIPADAGLRLAVRAGLAVGIPGVGVSGGLEIGGTLGLEGAAEAGVHVEWMPSEGLTLDAYGRISVQPKFVFDISGYVEAKALLFTLYENRWELASFEFGSDLRFGICFPIHYQEGEPFDISLEDVVFEVPDVNPREILGDLIDRIV